jgi:hypothetical protein
MASEMRRMARALVEHRAESFASRHGRDESESRLRSAIAAIKPRRLRFESRWSEAPSGLSLDAEFHPTARTQRMLQASSLVMVALIAASAWALLSDQVARTLAFLLALATLLWVLALPLVVAAFGAQREAEEARIRRALKRALTDEDESGAGRSR